ncbi:lipid-A-disaccharide synthase [Planctomicrobium sp. SH664]|uniref:lipid-A-disaccharide synthase n=1 Tax=Planctomicrobium sp. SH664 TaxID=3448125 RepID=UPI003F5BD7D2
MHLFFSAGEPSGDQHAAQVMQQLKKRHPGIRLSGFGGPEMAAAGQDRLYQLTDLAVMGLAGVLPLLKTFWRLYKEAEAFLLKEKPDGVVLVDFPGFNWWIAKAAKRAGVPVFYYCPPQLWAWAPWRIRKVHRWVTCVLSVLKFEADWYRNRNVDVELVGHPFFDEVAAHPLDQQAVRAIQAGTDRVVGILPGSRKQEVERNFPIMLQVIEALHRKHPDVRFPVACFKQWHYDRCAQLLAAHGGNLPVDLHLSRTPEVIEAADCCLMVSGSVSLELLARKTPAVVLYKAGLFIYCIGIFLGTIKYMSLPNLIADRVVMPEFPFWHKQRSATRQMIKTLDHWLSDPQALAHVQQEVSQLADDVVATGGVARAAEVLLQRLTATDKQQQHRRAA